jgi:FkbM family methyltransferase
MDYPLTFRTHTIDQAIFHQVVIENEYRLPDQFAPDDVILDIGTHIGSFCYAALTRGAGRVHGVEAWTENYQMASSNLRDFSDRLTLHHKAVWRSDREVSRLFFNIDPSPGQTAGGFVFDPASHEEDAARYVEKVEVIRFDDLVLQATDNGQRRVRMLKIDCEGSEFPILLTARQLFRVDAIVGEFHESQGLYDHNRILPNAIVEGYDKFTIELLEAQLRRLGFEVAWQRNSYSLDTGEFFAWRGREFAPVGLLEERSSAA